MSSATPAEVLARRSQLILNGDADGFADLFAPDAVIESSFAGPPVVITEMRAKATLTTTGRPFTTTSVQVLRIREGRIVLFRDFADPRILEDAIGELGRGGENHGPFGEKSS